VKCQWELDAIASTFRQAKHRVWDGGETVGETPDETHARQTQDTEQEPEELKKIKIDARPDFPDRVVEAWNTETTGTPLPKARALTPDRRKHLAARAKEHGEEAVFAAIRNMAASDFHSGKSGKWTEGNIGWLLKSPENFTKMLERNPPTAAGYPKPLTPDVLTERAVFYRKIGRDDDAKEAEEQAERIRRSTSIGDLTQQFRQAAH